MLRDYFWFGIVLCLMIFVVSMAHDLQETANYDKADLNRDGVVDALDASIMFQNWTPRLDFNEASASGGLR